MESVVSRVKIGHEITNVISNETPSREFVQLACKKRKASTPHPNHIKQMIGLETPDEKPVAKHLFMSEFKDRVLTSALKSKNITQSVSKSVKFKTTRITREFNNENVFDREEAEKSIDENQENICFDDAPKRLEFDDDKNDSVLKEASVCSERSTMADSEFELRLEESTKMEDENSSMIFEEKQIDIDSMMSNIPILSRTDEIRKSIIEKVTSSARKSIGELSQTCKSSITIEPIANAVLLHKCSTVKEFESPFRTDNKYSLTTTSFSPIKNDKNNIAEVSKCDVLNQEFIEAKNDPTVENRLTEELSCDKVNFGIVIEDQNELATNQKVQDSKECQKEVMVNDQHIVKEKVKEIEEVINKEIMVNDECMEEEIRGVEESNNEHLINEKIKETEEVINKEVMVNDECMEEEKSLDSKEKIPFNEHIEENILWTKKVNDKTILSDEKQSDNCRESNDILNNVRELGPIAETVMTNIVLADDEKMEEEENIASTINEFKNETIKDDKQSEKVSIKTPEDKNSVVLEKDNLTAPEQINSTCEIKSTIPDNHQDNTNTISIHIEILEEKKKITKDISDDNQQLLDSDKMIQDKINVETNQINMSPVIESTVADKVIGSINFSNDSQSSSIFDKESANESLNMSDKTLEDKNESNDDIDLNMSSVSNTEPNQMCSQESTDKLILPDEPPTGLSRSNSQTSLYSQISSVSEHMEEKRGLKRRQPVAKTRPADNAKIEPRATRTSTLRRKSELPKSETRVTRGNSRASLEPEKLTTRTITRRNSKRIDTKLGQVAEEEPAQAISVANLKKHNAQMETEESKPKSVRSTRSKARSPSPSASSIVSCSSMASIDSVSTVTSVKTRGRKSKKAELTEQMDKTLKADEDDASEIKEEQTSPTNSIASVSSINSSASTRLTRRSTRVVKKEEHFAEEESSPKNVRKYGLRKKKEEEEEEEESKTVKTVKKTTRTRSFREAKSDDVEKPKVTRTRSLRSSTSDAKNTETVDKAKTTLSKINETTETKADSKHTATRILLRKYDSQK